MEEVRLQDDSYVRQINDTLTLLDDGHLLHKQNETCFCKNHGVTVFTISPFWVHYCFLSLHFHLSNIESIFN